MRTWEVRRRLRKHDHEGRAGTSLEDAHPVPDRPDDLNLTSRQGGRQADGRRDREVVIDETEGARRPCVGDRDDDPFGRGGLR